MSTDQSTRGDQSLRMSDALQRVLTDSQAIWRLLDATTDFVTVGSLGRPPVYVNPAIRRALGIGPAEHVETLLEFRSPGFARYLREVIVPACKRDGVWRGRADYVTRDGDVIPTSQVAVFTRASDGTEHLAIIAREITAVEHADRALRETEERTRFALQAAHAGVWEADLRTGRVIWSDTMRAVQGFSDEEFGGTMESFLALVHPSDRELIRQAIDPALDRPTDFSFEFRVLWPDGTLHWVASHGRVLTDPSGHPIRVMAMAQDITRRKELEAQLRQAQQIEAIGQLAGGLAHDFNNYLTAVLGHASFLEQDLEADDPRRVDATQIRRAGERAAALTRQLLAFSRRQVLQAVRLDVHELLGTLKSMLASLLGEHIELVYDLDAGNPVIEADPGQIEQAIVNVAINAHDAMERGGTFSVATRLARLDAERARQIAVPAGTYLEVSLTDTGGGIPEEVRPRIFEPFFTTKTRGRGTGLGLATVFGVITQSGGGLDVTSRVGDGTTFRLFLPSRVVEPATEGSPATAQSMPRGDETILLVEDERAVRAIARTTLARQGYTVIEATCPDEAMRLAGPTEQIDLLLTDVVMPGLSGPDLYRRLREQRPSLRVLFMSGFADDAVARHGLVDSGTAPFLPKPFTAPDLVASVRRVLDAG